jgi:hypothetical protein
VYGPTVSIIVAVIDAMHTFMSGVLAFSICCWHSFGSVPSHRRLSKPLGRPTRASMSASTPQGMRRYLLFVSHLPWVAEAHHPTRTSTRTITISELRVIFQLHQHTKRQ